MSDMMTDVKDEAQKRLWRLGPRLAVYRHYKGGLYVLFAVSLSEDKLTPMCHYFSLEKKTRWTRTVENFTEEVDVPDGKAVRFCYEREATGDELCEAFGLDVGVKLQGRV